MNANEYTAMRMDVPEDSGIPSGIEDITRRLVQGAADAEELALTKAVLWLAISYLPRQRLDISLTERTKLFDEGRGMLMKATNDGALHFKIEGTK